MSTIPRIPLVIGLLLGFLARSASAVTPAAVIVVTNTNDSGAGSFRQALLDSNASTGVLDTITFNIPGAGPYTIVLASALPDITDPVSIDGTSQPGFSETPLIEVNGAAIASPNAVLTLSAGSCIVQALALNRGPDAGIRIRTSGGNKIVRTFIGTDASGTIGLGNASHGVVVENVSSNEIGSASGVLQRCIIAANGGHGVYVTGAAAANNVIGYSVIGSDAGLQIRLGNAGWGVLFESSFNSITSSVIVANGSGGVGIGAGVTQTGIDNTLIGTPTANGPAFGNGGPGISVGGSTASLFQFNIIAHNSGSGIVVAPAATGVNHHDNLLYDNGSPEVDLGGDGRSGNDDGDGDSGANNLQNYPYVTGIVFSGGDTSGRQATIYGRLDSAPSTAYTINVYPGVQGRTSDDAQVTSASVPSLVVITDAIGHTTFSFTTTLPFGTTILTATATDPAGNTSELSVPFVIPDLVAHSSACGTTGAELLLVLALAAGLRRRSR